jgi:hypothetical protein
LVHGNKILRFDTEHRTYSMIAEKYGLEIPKSNIRVYSHRDFGDYVVWVTSQ